MAGWFQPARCSRKGSPQQTEAKRSYVAQKSFLRRGPLEVHLGAENECVLGPAARAVVAVEHCAFEIEDVFQISREDPVQACRPRLRFSAGSRRNEIPLKCAVIDLQRVISRRDLKRAEVAFVEVEVAARSNAGSRVGSRFAREYP